MDFPLESIHKYSFNASLAAHCAADQGKFWEMHDRLFANSSHLEPVADHATAIGLDTAAFNECMSTRKHEPDVRSNIELAKRAGATGTPSFVIGTTDPDDPGKVTGIAFLRGAQPFSAFRLQIEKALKATP